jgi:hypothetical protein
MIHEAIVSVLKAAAGVTAYTDKVRPVEAESTDDAPYVTYELEDENEEYASAGTTNVIHAVVAIRCWGTDYTQAAKLDKAVKAALHAAVGSTVTTTNASSLIRRLHSSSATDIAGVGKLGKSKAARGRLRTYSITYKQL